MSKWIACTLDTLGTIVGGSTPSTQHKEYYDGDIPWITPKDLSNFNERYIGKGARNITRAGFSSCSTQLLPKGSVLFTSRAPIGYIAIAANDVCTNQGFKSIVPSNKVDSLFLFYLLKYNKNNIEALGTGTTFKEVSGTTMKSATVTLPVSLQEQKAIAAVLSALDDKIEVNRAINKNLEATAQAIFKSWFVDFEPFGGVMPANAQITELKKLCSVVTKGTTPTTLGMSFRDYGVNFIKAESILQNHSFDVQKFSYIDNETNEILKRSMLNVGDIVFTIAGTLGRFSLVDASILPANTNQAVAIIRPDTSLISSEYLYSFFVGNWHNIYYTSRIQQAVQANLSLTTIKTLPVILLDYKEKQEYTELITPLFEKIRQNLSQNQRLAAIRDTLLPKLMSGEINVSQVKI